MWGSFRKTTTLSIIGDLSTTGQSEGEWTISAGYKDQCKSSLRLTDNHARIAVSRLLIQTPLCLYTLLL